MRKKIAQGLLLFCLFSTAGCGSLPKKFIRKKVEPAHTPSVVYLEKGPYQKKFSNDYYYKMHYTLWKTWQGEILDNLGGNSKKLQRSAEEAYSQLESMNRYLNPEKQAQLKPLLDELGKITGRFQANNYSKSEQATLRSDIDRIRRVVGNDFYYDKVKDDLQPDNVDLGPE